MEIFTYFLTGVIIYLVIQTAVNLYNLNKSLNTIDDILNNN